MNNKRHSLLVVIGTWLFGLSLGLGLCSRTVLAIPQHGPYNSVCTLDIPEHIGKPSFCGADFLHTSKLSCTGPSDGPPVISMRFVGTPRFLDPQKTRWSSDHLTLDLGCDLTRNAPAGFSTLEITLGSTPPTTLSFNLVVDVVPPTISVNTGREYSILITDSHSPITEAELIVPESGGKFSRFRLDTITTRVDPSNTSERQLQFILPIRTSRASVVVASDTVGNLSFKRLDGRELGDFLLRYGEFQRTEREATRIAAQAESSAAELRGRTEEYALPLAVLYVHPPGLSTSELGERFVQLQSIVESGIDLLDLEFMRNHRPVPGFREASRRSVAYFARGVDSGAVRGVSITPGQGAQFAVQDNFDLPNPALFENGIDDTVERLGQEEFSVPIGDPSTQPPIAESTPAQFFEHARKSNPFWSGIDFRSRLVIVLDRGITSPDNGEIAGFYHLSSSGQPVVYMMRTDDFETNNEITSRLGMVLVHELMHSFGFNHILNHNEQQSNASFMPIGDSESGNLMRSGGPEFRFSTYRGHLTRSLTVAQTILLQHRIWGLPDAATAAPAVIAEFGDSLSSGTEQFLYRERWGVGQRLSPPLVEFPFDRNAFPSVAGQGPCCSWIQPRFPEWTFSEASPPAEMDRALPFINHASFSQRNWKSYMPGKIDPNTGLVSKRRGTDYEDVFRITPGTKRVTVGVQQISELLFEPPGYAGNKLPRSAKDWAQQSASAAGVVELPVPLGPGPHFLRVKTRYNDYGVKQVISTGSSIDPYTDDGYSMTRKWAELSDDPTSIFVALIVRPSEVTPEGGDHYLVPE